VKANDLAVNLQKNHEGNIMGAYYEAYSYLGTDPTYWFEVCQILLSKIPKPKFIKPDTVKDEELSTEPFQIPPMSILNSHKGEWTRLEKKWKELKELSSGGRKTGLVGASDGYILKGSNYNGTSIFSPALTETLYKFFPPRNIIDPFCGSVTRGAVAASLGIEYTGIDIRKEQIDFNKEHYPDINWVLSDGTRYIPTQAYDMLFTCPPYYDLERYSDDPNDLSNQATYEGFSAGIKRTFANITPFIGSYVVIVISDIRDEYGFYRGMPDRFVRILDELGWGVYNRMYLYQVGSAFIRAERNFRRSQKVSKVQQQILVFKRKQQ
jgi:hypothetical protein